MRPAHEYLRAHPAERNPISSVEAVRGFNTTGRAAEQPRKTLATYGPRGQRIRVLLDRHSELVRVQWYEQNQGRVKSWPDSPEGRRDADAWAAGFALSRIGGQPKVERITTRRIWQAFVDAVFHTLRANTRRNYRDAWNKWEVFHGREWSGTRWRGLP